MKPNRRSLYLACCLGAASLAVTSMASAACSRDDVEYYLGKGFTTSQITALCTHGASPAPTQAPATAPAPAATPTTQPAPAVVPAQPQAAPAQPAAPAAVAPVVVSQNPNERFLQTAIDGRDITLSSDALTYTTRVCIEYGVEDLTGFTPTACPDVKYTISLNGLVFDGVKKEYMFFGRTVARVEGQADRQVVGNFNIKSKQDRKKVLRLIDTGNVTDVPMRSGISSDEISKVFYDIAR